MDVALDIVSVDEEVLAAVVWCDKSKTFLDVEKLDGAFRFVRFGHEKLPFLLFYFHKPPCF